MAKYNVEWYIDLPGMDGIRVIEVEAKNEEDANEQAYLKLTEHFTIGETNEIK